MTDASASPTLERLGQIAFILMCLAVAAAGLTFIWERVQLPTSAMASPPIEPGTRIDVSRWTSFEKNPTLLMVLSSTCSFCEQSIPFYQELMQADSIRQSKIKVMAGAVEKADLLERYLADQQLEIREVVSMRETGLRVRGTPTLILINAGGEVVESWAGLLDVDAERQVRNAIERLITS